MLITGLKWDIPHSMEISDMEEQQTGICILLSTEAEYQTMVQGIREFI